MGYWKKSVIFAGQKIDPISDFFPKIWGLISPASIITQKKKYPSFESSFYQVFGEPKYICETWKLMPKMGDWKMRNDFANFC